MAKNTITTEQIMQDIRKEAAKKKAENPIDSTFFPLQIVKTRSTTIKENRFSGITTDKFDDIDEKELREAGIFPFEEVLVNSYIVNERPVSGNFISRFFKNKYRKSILSYIRPIFEEQNEFNEAILSNVNILKRDYVGSEINQAKLKKQQYAVLKEIYEVQKKQYELEEEYSALKNSVYGIKADIFTLEVESDTSKINELNQYVHRNLEKENKRLQRQYEALVLENATLKERLSSLENTLSNFKNTDSLKTEG